MADTETKLKLYEDVYYKGIKVCPRKEEVIELLNYSFTLQSPYNRFFNFKGRKMNLKYIKKELKWYFKGDKFDKSISVGNSIWKNIINKDGSINSQYGHYLFTQKNFLRCANSLLIDKDTRRAVIHISNNDVLGSDTKDYPCTLSLTFHIRQNKLFMSVVMRSNDVIFGITNDIPFFTLIHEMMYVYLKASYPHLQLGSYYHLAHSMHIYKRHYKMTEEILEHKEEIPINCPEIRDIKEVLLLINGKFDRKYEFTNWLMS